MPCRRGPHELLPHDGEGLADEAGDVHLRQAHALGYLRLRQALLESHAQNLALAVRQPVERRLERRTVLGALELRVLAADRLERVEVLIAARARGEGDRGV